MNFEESVKTMSVLENPTKEYVNHLLKCSMFILTGYKNNYDDTVIEHAVHVEAGVVTIYKMSDSTAEDTILTPESAALCDEKYFDFLWLTVFANRIIIIDTEGVLRTAKILTYNFDYDVLKDTLKKNEILFFKDAPAEAYKCQATRIYIVPTDNPGMEDVISDIVNATNNTEIVASPVDADYSILAMPANMLSQGKSLFSYCDTSDNCSENPYIKTVLAIFEESIPAPFFPKNTFLLWTRDLFKLTLESKSKALLQASLDLSAIIEVSGTKKA